MLLGKIQQSGLDYTLCTPPSEWQLQGATGMWIAIFVGSKWAPPPPPGARGLRPAPPPRLPELFDTVFLVLRGKNVIFLHWFHHVTVCLYCWHSWANQIPPGIFFASMNYAVHSIMYFYYFATYSRRVTKALRPFSPLITTAQILQMVGGMAILLRVGYLQSVGGREACPVNPPNWKLGLAMYASYCLLFCELFYYKYVSPEPSSKRDRREDVGCFPNARTTDASGLFHPPSQAVESPPRPEKPKGQ